MRKFAELTKRIEKSNNGKATKMFGKEFRSPGHIPICIASKNLLNDRTGHTELVVSLLKMARITPVGSGCEIMGDNGKALSKIESKKYAKDNGLIFLEGKEIIKAWKKWSK
jgi:3,4-dihydroxy 2-butanone 4-phosphate synthase